MSGLEWQVASGSSMAHVIDTSRPVKRRPERGWKSGPRSLCGRNPQRNLEPPWFGLPVCPEADEALRRYMAQQCAECLDRLRDGGDR